MFVDQVVDGTLSQVSLRKGQGTLASPSDTTTQLFTTTYNTKLTSPDLVLLVGVLCNHVYL